MDLRIWGPDPGIWDPQIRGLRGPPPGDPPGIPGPPGFPPRVPDFPPGNPRNPGFRGDPPRDPGNPGFPGGPPGDPLPGAPEKGGFRGSREPGGGQKPGFWGVPGGGPRGVRFGGPKSVTLARILGGFPGAAGLLINVFFGPFLVCFSARGERGIRSPGGCPGGPPGGGPPGGGRTGVSGRIREVDPGDSWDV